MATVLGTGKPSGKKGGWKDTVARQKSALNEHQRSLGFSLLLVTFILLRCNLHMAHCTNFNDVMLI